MARAAGALTLALIATMAHACTQERAVRVVIDAGGRGRSVVVWELRVGREACDALDVATLARVGAEGAVHWQRFGGDEAPSAPGRLAAGRYALSALGRDASCAPVVVGCTVFEGAGDEVRIAVTAADPIDPVCGPGLACDAGRCVDPGDAGPPADAGGDAAPPDDAGADAATPDDAGAPGACDPIADRGCEEGSRCAIEAGEARCVASGGSTPELAACAAADDCAPGLGCHAGRCHEYCRDAADCQNDGVLCEPGSVPGADDLPAGIQLCGAACNPHLQSLCPDGQSCTVTRGSDAVLRTHCTIVGGVGPGFPCTESADCDERSYCELDPEISRPACRRFCVSPAERCTSGVICELQGVVRGIQIGACLDRR